MIDRRPVSAWHRYHCFGPFTGGHRVIALPTFADLLDTGPDTEPDPWCMLQVDGHKPVAATVRRVPGGVEMVRSSTAVLPDPTWRYEDPAGHVHAFDGGKLPTLTSHAVHVPCDGSCLGICGGEGYHVTRWRCGQCGADVEPGFVPDVRARTTGIPFQTSGDYWMAEVDEEAPEDGLPMPEWAITAMGGTRQPHPLVGTVLTFAAPGAVTPLDVTITTRERVIRGRAYISDAGTVGVFGGLSRFQAELRVTAPPA